MKAFIRITIALLLVVGLFATYVYFGVFQKTISLEQDEKTFYISTGSSFDEVIKNLKDSLIIDNTFLFGELAEMRHLPGNIYPGKYTIQNEITWTDLIIQLRSAQVDEVTVTFNNVRTIEELCEKVAGSIEASEAELKSVLMDKNERVRLGFDEHTFIALFLPNTYRFYWNTSAKDFLQRMQQEYKAFWTNERKRKAKALGLSQSEVSTLASIVQAEQSVIEEEWPIIAGLYINRLNQGVKLESDPTVIFGVGDFSIRRVLHKHLESNSPYNTYRRRGLPPGPIRIPSTRAIDAVLNYKRHDFIFMCAAPEMTGRHRFTASYRKHLQNAKEFQQALNKRKIYE